MTLTNILSKLNKAGFIATEKEGGMIQVEIWNDKIHQADYVNPCAEAVVLPLNRFCAIHSLHMQRTGGVCFVKSL